MSKICESVLPEILECHAMYLDAPLHPSVANMVLDYILDFQNNGHNTYIGLGVYSPGYHSSCLSQLQHYALLRKYIQHFNPAVTVKSTEGSFQKNLYYLMK